MHPQKVCKRCGGAYRADVFFRKNRGGSSFTHEATHSICIGCEQKSRDDDKSVNRFPRKAADAIRRHDASFLKRGLIKNAGDLASVFGWDRDTIAHDFEFAYNNGCAYCGRPYKTMGHGLADITIDVIHVNEPPYYTTNTKLCCATCNTEKSNTPAHLWAAKLIEWAKWEARQVYLAGKQWIGPLFDGDWFK